MRLPKEFFRLPISFDAETLREEAAQFDESVWQPHPSGFPGNSALPLISMRGEINDAFEPPMEPTPHLARCPYIQQAIASFGSVVGRARLMRLGPGAEVKEHADYNHYWFDRVRIHIPIVTNPGVIFHCHGKQVHMAAGEAWTFNNWLRHHVVNGSDQSRIHLVFDTVGTRGFWDMLRKSDNPGIRRIEPDDGPPPDIVTERYEPPIVMEPAEVERVFDVLVGELRARSDNNREHSVRAQKAMYDFGRDWRSLWLAYGPSDEAIPDFQRLVIGFVQAMAPIGPNLRLAANDTPLGEVLRHFAAYLVRLPENLGGETEGMGAKQAKPKAPASRLKPDVAFDKPLIVIGAPRSGTTLLFETLATHKDLWSLSGGGESHWHIEVIESLNPARRNFESNRLLAEDASDDIRDRLMANFVTDLRDRSGLPLLGATGRPTRDTVRLLEKTPKNSLRIPFLDRIFPDARYIFLVRGARQNISSMMEAWTSGRFVTYPELPGWPGPPWSLILTPGWRDLAGKPLAEIAANQWTAANTIAAQDLADIDETRRHMLSYEDFLEDPAGAVRAICRFADLAFTEAMATMLARPLRQSRFTLTPPEPDKWRKNAEAMAPFLDAAEALERRLKEGIERPARARRQRAANERA